MNKDEATIDVGEKMAEAFDSSQMEADESMYLIVVYSQEREM